MRERDTHTHTHPRTMKKESGSREEAESHVHMDERVGEQGDSLDKNELFELVLWVSE